MTKGRERNARKKKGEEELDNNRKYVEGKLKACKTAYSGLIRGHSNITNVIISNFNNFTGSLKGVKLLFLGGR